jgi:hypothetical protein
MKRYVIPAIALSFACLLSLYGKDKKQTGVTDRLNAPTADGSPTLKQTSDWLAQMLLDMAGYDKEPAGLEDKGTWTKDDMSSIFHVRYPNVSIDNSCSLHWNNLSWYAGWSGRAQDLPKSIAKDATSSQHNVLLSAIPLDGGVFVSTFVSNDGNLNLPSVVIQVPDFPRVGDHATYEFPIGINFGGHNDTREDVAARIQKALQHAIELSRSVGCPQYTALPAPPPKPKEPF